MRDIGAVAGLAAFIGLAVLWLLYFIQARDVRRLRDWAGRAPERDAELQEATSAVAAGRAEELRKIERVQRAEAEAAEQRESRRGRRQGGEGEGRLDALLDRSGGWPRLVAAIVVGVLVLGAAGYGVSKVVGGGDTSTKQAQGKNGKNAGNKGGGAASGDQTQVAVLNATPTAGLATTFANKVEENGFHPKPITNAPSTTTYIESAVMYAQGNRSDATSLADALSITRVDPMTSEVAGVSQGAPVAVILGQDFGNLPAG